MRFLSACTHLQYAPNLCSWMSRSSLSGIVRDLNPLPTALEAVALPDELTCKLHSARSVSESKGKRLCLSRTIFRGQVMNIGGDEPASWRACDPSSDTRR